MPLRLRRRYIQLTKDIVPGLLRRFGRKSFQPTGRERPASDEWGVAIPFRYNMPTHNVRTAVVCHIFHAEMTEDIISCLSGAGLQADLLISTDAEDKAQKIREVIARWRNGSATVRLVENRGRDIAPKLVTFADLYERYE